MNLETSFELFECIHFIFMTLAFVLLFLDSNGFQVVHWVYDAVELERVIISKHHHLFEIRPYIKLFDNLILMELKMLENFPIIRNILGFKCIHKLWEIIHELLPVVFSYELTNHVLFLTSAVHYHWPFIKKAFKSSNDSALISARVNGVLKLVKIYRMTGVRHLKLVIFVFVDLESNSVWAFWNKNDLVNVVKFSLYFLTAANQIWVHNFKNWEHKVFIF